MGRTTNQRHQLWNQSQDEHTFLAKQTLKSLLATRLITVDLDVASLTIEMGEMQASSSLCDGRKGLGNKPDSRVGS